jgi:hypothetical protein
MKPTIYRPLAAFLLIFLVFTVACSSKPFLKVQYQLPSSTASLDGRSVALEFSDKRVDKMFLAPDAKKSLKDFDRTFSLIVLNADGSGNLVGVFELFPLLSEVFTHRLKNEGLEVTKAANEEDSTLEVEINEFALDLAKGKWIVKMNYTGHLIKDAKVRSSQTINGTAERLKVAGKSDAEKILGELLTDMVNRLDVQRLFQQAGL